MKTLRVIFLIDGSSDIDQLTHEISKSGLKHEYQVVQTYEDYVLALEKRPDVIIADYDLIQFGTRNAIETIKSKGFDIPFIVIGDISDEDVIVDCIRNGAADYLLKERLYRLGHAVKRSFDDSKIRQEKRNSEAKLVQSEEKYSSLIEQLPVGVYRSDKNGFILGSNSTFRTLFEIDPTIQRPFSLKERYKEPIKWEEHLKKFQDAAIVMDEFRVKTSRGTLWLRDTGKVIRSETGKLLFIDGIVEDITLWRENEEQLFIQKFALEATSSGIVITDHTFHILWVNQAYTDMSGFEHNEVVTKDIRLLHPYQLSQDTPCSAWDLVTQGQVFQGELSSIRKNGTAYIEMVSITPVFHKKSNIITHYIITKQDISERVNAANETRKKNVELEALNKIIRSISTNLDLNTIINTLLSELTRILTLNHAGAMILDESGEQLVLVAEYNPDKMVENVGIQIPLQSTATIHSIFESRQPLAIYDAQNDPGLELIGDLLVRDGEKSLLIVPIEVRGNVLGLIAFSSKILRNFSDDEIRFVDNSVKAVSQAIGNVLLFDEIRQRVAELEAVSKVSFALRSAATRSEMPAIVIDQLLSLMKANAVAFITNRPGKMGSYCELANGEWAHLTGMSIIDKIDRQVSVTWVKHELDRGYPVGLIIQDESLGELRILREYPFNENERRLLTSVADIVVNAMQRALLHESTKKRMQRLSILHNIDVAISASFDVRGIINVIIDQVVSQLGVDAADLLLFDQSTFSYKMMSNRGFFNVPSKKDISATDGRMAEFALSRKSVHLRNLADEENFLRSRELRKEGFISYDCIPLVSKGEYKGILEVFHRKPVDHEVEWLEFLETICGQAAVAIDHMTLVNSLQRSNFEIIFAMDLALEKVAKILEQRGYEPIGHTQRNIELTISLAKEVGIHDEEIPHIRRGVLLHDIGKLSVPEHIQLKPGSLNEQEWEHVRNHVLFGYDTFSSISFLRPALDIPYCHHEKWDGNGYPRKLTKAEIPLSARIFSLVDVWDCLTHDRPYRKAWTESRVLEYIKFNAGTHFDPEIVKPFLKLMGQKLNLS